MRVNTLLMLSFFGVCGACDSSYSFKETPEAEGDESGECSDAADNDGDFDCDNSDCASSPECWLDGDEDGVCDAEDSCPDANDNLDREGDSGQRVVVRDPSFVGRHRWRWPERLR